MTAGSHTAGGRRAAVFFAALAVSACIGAGAATRPLVADNQLYFFMAERAAAGIPPHVSLVDSKSQLGTLVGAAAITGGRAAGIDDVAATRIASIAAASAAIAGVAALTGAVTGSWLAAMAAALALLATRGFVDHAAIGSNPKTFLAAFAVAAHLMSARDRPFAAGVAAGCAFLCWQPALLIVAAVGAEMLARRGVRPALRTAAGAALAVLLYELYFLERGALGEQLAQTYLMTLGSLHEPVAWADSLRFVLTEGRAQLPPRVAPLLFAALLAGGAVLGVRRPRRALAALRGQGGRISLVLAAAGTIAFTLYDHQGVPDAFFPAPYIAVGAGAACAAVASVFGATRLVAAATAAAMIAQLYTGGVRLPRDGFTVEDQRSLARDLLMLRDRYGEVWAYGAVHLLALAHLDNYLPYGQLYDDIGSRFDIHAYEPRREGRLPALIVRGPGPMPGASRYLDRYERLEEPAFHRDRVRVYRLAGQELEK